MVMVMVVGSGGDGDTGSSFAANMVMLVLENVGW